MFYYSVVCSNTIHFLYIDLIFCTLNLLQAWPRFWINRRTDLVDGWNKHESLCPLGLEGRYHCLVPCRIAFSTCKGAERQPSLEHLLNGSEIRALPSNRGRTGTKSNPSWGVRVLKPGHVFICLTGTVEKSCLSYKFRDSGPFKKARSRGRDDLLILYSEPTKLHLSFRCRGIIWSYFGTLFSSSYIVF